MHILPRRKGSIWSKINVNHIDKLIEQDQMQPAGLAHVDAAKADGRWEAAYLGASEMTIPNDFLAKIENIPIAKATFDTLNRSQLYTIYFNLQTAKKPETRKNRMAKLIAKLAQGQKT